jgi:hypothetical protein
MDSSSKRFDNHYIAASQDCYFECDRPMQT